MKVTVILILDGALGIVTKGLEKKQNEFKFRVRIDTIHTVVSLRSGLVTWNLPSRKFQTPDSSEKLEMSEKTELINAIIK